MTHPVTDREADDFNGDNASLVRSIEALISLSDKGALVPHGLGGHARTLLAAAAVRLSHTDASKARFEKDYLASRDHSTTV